MSITFVFIFVAWIFSLCLHECAHAVVAYMGGDYTVKEKGYLSLNPLKFTNPFLSIILPLIFLLIGGIGLPGGCVYIERHLLRSRGWDCLVSLAGPAANIVLAILLAFPFCLGIVDSSPENPLWSILAFLIFLQVFAVVLNMLPIPGLDGFGALSAWMDPGLRARVYQYSNMAIIMFFVIIFNYPEANMLLWQTVGRGCILLQVDLDMVQQGLNDFRLF